MNALKRILNYFNNKPKNSFENNAENSVNFLRAYIIENKNDSGGSWEYFHTPFLTNYLTNLSEPAINEFSITIFEWSENELYEIADPIIFCENSFINSEYLYCKIFSKTTDIENLEYLVENLYPTKDELTLWERDLLEGLEKNLNLILPKKEGLWKIRIIETLNHIYTELKNRQNNYS